MLFLLKTENLLYADLSTLRSYCLTVLIEILSDLILSIAIQSFTNKKSKFIINLPNTVMI